jgi:hypothetical protein
MTPDQRDAEARRDFGMRTTEQNAGSMWQRDAVEQIRRFCGVFGRPFMCEEVRDFATRCGLREPPNRKAWGPAIKAAESAGVVEPIGYAPANSSNRSPKVLWRAVRAGVFSLFVLAVLVGQYRDDRGNTVCVYSNGNTLNVGLAPCPPYIDL